MSLPHALLGLLSYKPATGYDLKAAFESSINLFWNASLPQIYRTLSQMEKDGWLSFIIKHQEGKPSRKIYQMTDKGKKELQNWLAAPPEVPQAKSSLLVKLFFGNQMNRKDLAANIRKWREHYTEFLKIMDKNILPSAKGFAREVANKDELQFWMMAADYGVRNARMVVDWCDASLAVIEKNTRVKRTKQSRRAID